MRGEEYLLARRADSEVVTDKARIEDGYLMDGRR